MNKKSIKIIYWIFTVLFVAFMLFSGVIGLIGSEDGDQVMVDLGYPLYLNTILGIAKILGSIALVIPNFRTIKEWAYAGFTFDIIGASASFLFSGMGAGATIFALLFLIPLAVSYWGWKELL